jgi:organic hydroperoxide reductase OsmC/OhrA
MNIDHEFSVGLEWQGNRGSGTSSVRDFSRANIVIADGPEPIAGSSAPAFRGDPARWNPEQLLIASLSQCHMLSYLYSAATHGVVVTAYTDAATGTLRQVGDGGHLTEVTLRPVVTIASGDRELARELHAEAAANCFIASSINFPVTHEITILAG